MSNKSRARKNRNKYKTLRKIGYFKIFMTERPNCNGYIYPTLKTSKPVFDEKLLNKLSQAQGVCFSISSHVDEGLVAPKWEDTLKGIWNVGTQHAQDSSLMESHFDRMCKVMGVSRENLEINEPVSFASSGIWSNPVDVSNLQGPGIEEVIAEDLVYKAKHQLLENTKQRIIEVAESFGEDIEVDSFLLRDDIKVFRQRNDVYDLVPIEYDSHEWAIVMVALHRRPEILDHLKAKGYDFIHIQRVSAIETTIDAYQIFDTTNGRDAEAFKPFKVEHSVDFTVAEIVGDSISKFAKKKLNANLLGKTDRLTTLKLDWD